LQYASHCLEIVVLQGNRFFGHLLCQRKHWIRYSMWHRIRYSVLHGMSNSVRQLVYMYSSSVGLTFKRLAV